jgi:hypothetical protein
VRHVQPARQHAQSIACDLTPDGMDTNV